MSSGKAYFAFGKQQLYAATRIAVHDSVVLSLVIIAQVVERGGWGLRRRVLRSRERGCHCLGGQVL